MWEFWERKWSEDFRNEMLVLLSFPYFKVMIQMVTWHDIEKHLEKLSWEVAGLGQSSRTKIFLENRFPSRPKIPTHSLSVFRTRHPHVSHSFFFFPFLYLMHFRIKKSFTTTPTSPFLIHTTPNCTKLLATRIPERERERENEISGHRERMREMLGSCCRPLERCFNAGGGDDLLWHTDLKRHASGDYSIAVVQANSSLEDQGQVFTSPSATYIGVYDGHGGPEASRFITSHIFPFLHSQ